MRRLLVVFPDKFQSLLQRRGLWVTDGSGPLQPPPAALPRAVCPPTQPLTQLTQLSCDSDGDSGRAWLNAVRRGRFGGGGGGGGEWVGAPL